jgi:dynein heavy chain 2
LFLNISRCLLSTQQHYDWGLRALKTVLKGCGSALRSVRKTGQMQLNAETEAELAVRALRLNTLSKLTSADCERLDALLLDIFPGIKLTESCDEELVAALKASCRQLQLEENPTQVIH